MTNSGHNGLINYNPETGEFSGCTLYTTNKEYKALRIKGKHWLAHRLAFKLMGLEVPPQVDHINGNRQDNRWCNLRPADAKINGRNCKTPERNTSGIMGVTWDKQTNKWKAQITVNGKNINLGRFTDINEAAKVRKKADKLYGFHSNHGRKAT